MCIDQTWRIEEGPSQFVISGDVFDFLNHVNLSSSSWRDTSETQNSSIQIESNQIESNRIYLWSTFKTAVLA